MAPDFTLPRSSYAAVSLADFRGRRVILVFYPADWEPVSQQQLTLYQDYLAAFSRLGAVLLAISTDHVWCHGAFARAAGSPTRCSPTRTPTEPWRARTACMTSRQGRMRARFCALLCASALLGVLLHQSERAVSLSPV